MNKPIMEVTMKKTLIVAMIAGLGLSTLSRADIAYRDTTPLTAVQEGILGWTLATVPAMTAVTIAERFSANPHAAVFAGMAAAFGGLLFAQYQWAKRGFDGEDSFEFTMVPVGCLVKGALSSAYGAIMFGLVAAPFAVAYPCGTFLGEHIADGLVCAASAASGLLS